jgi:hypothetical protein
VVRQPMPPRWRPRCGQPRQERHRLGHQNRMFATSDSQLGRARGPAAPSRRSVAP